MKQILRATFSFVKAGFKPLPVTVVVIVVLLIIPLFVGQRGMGMAGLLLGTAIGVWTRIAVHELGHLVLGKLVDFRFVLYVAGPLAVLRTVKGVRISGNESWLLPGLTAMMPEHVHSLRRRFLWMMAGGPLANLLVFTLIGSLFATIVSVVDKRTLLDAVFAQPPFWKWAAIVCIMSLFQMAGLSVLMTITSLWPHRAKKTGMMSDGGRIRMLLRGGVEADRWIALMMLVNTSMSGRRPREWDSQ